jgi:hypothetical protein
VILCEANPRVKEKLARAGVVAMVGERHVVDHFADALEIVDPASRDQQETERDTLDAAPLSAEMASQPLAPARI